MNVSEVRKGLDQFEAHYGYDTTFLKEMLSHDPEGYAHFQAFMPMASHRMKLEVDVYYVAKLATMAAEDCGACLQLNIKMALEAGVPKHLVEAAVKGGGDLPEDLGQIHAYATRVTLNNPDRGELLELLQQRLDKGAMSELALCIASARMFPSLKRSLGYDKSCQVMQFAI